MEAQTGNMRELQVAMIHSDINRCSSGGLSVSRFLDNLNDELDAVEHSTERELARIRLQCQKTLVRLKGLSVCYSTDDLALVDGLNQGYRNVLSHLQQTMTKAKQLVSHADERVSSPAQKLLQDRFSVAPWAPSSLSGLVILFSDAYEGIRMNRSEAPTNTVWEAPTAFARSTTKYWVEEGRLDMLLAVVTKDAPLLVYGQKWPLSTQIDQQKRSHPVWDQMASTISSVYFDTSTMAMYKDRIARKEGAQLFRIRWYGDRPKGDKLVFLELKTHHEKWINCKSVKERVSIREKDVMKFLSRTEWSATVALEILKAALPAAGLEKLKQDTDLLLRMHKLVITRNLRPCVRSVYQRLAFQSSESNALRLTIDRNVTLVDERLTTDGDWCLSDISSASKVVVPFAVFEVKLAGSEMPSNIQGLIDQSVVVEAEKFSKFLTGAAAFNRNAIRTLPYWASHPAFVRCFGESSGTALEKGISGTSTDTSSDSFPTEEGDEERTPFLSRLFCSKSLKVAPRRPARVEPKSFFANERTFIQWVGGAFFLLSLSVISAEVVGEVTHVIMFLLGLCVVLVLYSVFVYYRRLHLLQSGSPDGYVDRVGPLLLACTVLAGVVMVNVTAVSDSMSLNSIYESEKCFLHKMPMSSLEFEPSGIAVDTEREIFLIASRSKIYSISSDGKERIVANSGLADFEAVTFTPDGRIWAISEASQDKTDDSILYSFEWNTETQMLSTTGTWTIPAKGAEGMAYVPGTNGALGYLYIASDFPSDVQSTENSIGSKRGNIQVYPVPNVFQSAEPLSVLNNKVIGRGLTDSKIGEMQYLDGILYVLHDNAGVVRSWNLTSGDLVSEWKLPHVGDNGEFDDQWEGMFIEKRERSSSGLRGYSGGQSGTLLHLSLDSPAQVWTISVEEQNGFVRLPPCADPSYRSINSFFK